MHEDQQPRRLHSVPALDPLELPNPRRETAASILPGVPRVGALDALLREVDDLRLTLETDLGLAAAAVEAGGAATAAEIIQSDLETLHAFEGSALDHLADLAEKDAPQSRARLPWSRLARLSAAPFVAAAAVVGLMIGVVPTGVGQPAPEVATVSAQSTFEHLTDLAAEGRTSEVRVAAQTLHSQISALVGRAASNPAAAQQALLLLSYERTVIVQSGDSAALHDVLLQSAALAAKIRSSLPWAIRSAVPAAPTIVPAAPPAPKRQEAKPQPTASPTAAKPTPTAAATPTASATPSPTASPTTSPTPTASPSASSSPGSGTPFLPAGDPDPSPATLR